MSTIETACFEVLTGAPFKDATTGGAAPTAPITILVDPRAAHVVDVLNRCVMAPSLAPRVLSWRSALREARPDSQSVALVRARRPPSPSAASSPEEGMRRMLERDPSRPGWTGDRAVSSSRAVSSCSSRLRLACSLVLCLPARTLDPITPSPRRTDVHPRRIPRLPLPCFGPTGIVMGDSGGADEQAAAAALSQSGVSFEAMCDLSEPDLKARGTTLHTQKRTVERRNGGDGRVQGMFAGNEVGGPRAGVCVCATVGCAVRRLSLTALVSLRARGGRGGQTLGVAKLGPGASRKRLMSTIETACFEVLTGVPFKDATADSAAPAPATAILADPRAVHVVDVLNRCAVTPSLAPRVLSW